MFADELERFIQGRPIIARPIGRAHKVWRWCKRNPALASLASLAVLLLVNSALIASLGYLREAALRREQEQLTLSEREAKEEERTAKLQEIQAKEQAQSAKETAERATLLAEQEREKAKSSENLMRRNLYLSDASRTSDLIEEHNYQRAQSLLERHIPNSAAEEDLRGFDWYHNWHRLNSRIGSFDFEKPIEVFDLSEDEKTLAVGCRGGHAYLLNLEAGTVRNVAFAIEDDHWANLAFVDRTELIGHGQSGSFKLWNIDAGETLTASPGFFERQGNKTGYQFRISMPKTQFANPLGARNDR